MSLPLVRPNRRLVSEGTLQWWQVVALLGALQGVGLAVALLSKPDSKVPHALLAAAMLSFALYLASVAYYTPTLVAWFPHFVAVSFPVTFLFGPLIYLYAVSVSDRARRLTRRDLWHGVPFALAALSISPTYALAGAQKVALFQAITAGDLPIQAQIAGPLQLILGVAYAVATLLFLRRHQRVIAENYSSLERVNLSWLFWLTVGAGAVWTMATALDVAERLGMGTAMQSDHLIALALTALIYGIGYKGIRQPEIFRYNTAEYRVVKPAQTVEPTASIDETPIDETPIDEAPITTRVVRPGLTDREAERYKAKLLALMESERPYRNAELTLSDLAAQLTLTPHKLSELLNTQLNQSFYDFVNAYRVRELQQRLRSPDGARLTYLALALDAGFASKSTFNAVFKKVTGQTPSEYRNSGLA